MLKKIALLGLIVAMGVALAAPTLASNAVQGAVRDVNATTNSAIGASVACRIYSVSGPSTDVNANTGGPCLNARCLNITNGTPTGYRTAAVFGVGGYNCNQENTQGYNGGSPDPSIFYNIIDAEANTGTCNHVGFYAVQGTLGFNGTLDPSTSGDSRSDNCGAASAANCLPAAEASNAGPGLTQTRTTFGSTPNAISVAGGLAPIPTVRVSALGAGGCLGTQVHLTWDNPNAAILKGGVGNPIKGVNLYKNIQPSCDAGTCPNGTAGWTLVSNTLDANAGTGGVCQTVDPGGNYYALTVRVQGSGNAANAPTFETGRVGGVGFVGAHSFCTSPQTGTAVRIANVSARYAGRGTVNVTWTTGVEGGMQGFYVTRGTSPTGPFTRVSDLVPARGVDNSTYTQSSKIHATLGRVAYYSIELINNDGTVEHTASTGVTLPAGKNKFGNR